MRRSVSGEARFCPHRISAPWHRNGPHFDHNYMLENQLQKRSSPKKGPRPKRSSPYKKILNQFGENRFGRWQGSRDGKQEEMRKEHWIISTLKCLGLAIEHRFTGKGSRGGKQEKRWEKNIELYYIYTKMSRIWYRTQIYGAGKQRW